MEQHQSQSSEVPKDKGYDDNGEGKERNVGGEEAEIPQICSVCHNEPPTNPIKLNCGHIFCFLCVKSVFETTGICALCRAAINVDFDRQEHHVLGTIQVPSSRSGYFWFYEGYRGWWLYDPDTNRDIELAHEQNEPRIEKLIAGHVYVIDLQAMKQFRKHGDENRSRKICRATLGLENIIGMGGLRGREFERMLDMMRFGGNIRE